MSARNPFVAREVTSRRGGPSKAPLSRDAIVDAALGLMRKEGLGGLQMRKVAAALETGPASLYAYVDDAQALAALVLDRAIGGVDLRRRGDDWRADLRSLLSSYVRVLSEVPGLGQLAFGTVAYGPNVLRLYEALLGLLLEGGLDVDRAAWAVDLLLLHCTARAAERGNGLDPADEAGPLLPAMQSASPTQFPLLRAHLRELLAGPPKARGRWALDVLLNGILHTPVGKHEPQIEPVEKPRKKKAR